MQAATPFATLRQPAVIGLPRAFGAWLQALRARPAATTQAADLDKGATLWVDQPLARQVQCVQGTLWLTFDGEPQDVVLEAGQSLVCPHGSRLAIHALAPSCVQVQ